MKLTIEDQIKTATRRKGITLGDLAEMTSQTRQNLSVAFKRGTYMTDWLEKVADALDCDLVIEFVPRDEKRS